MLYKCKIRAKRVPISKFYPINFGILPLLDFTFNQQDQDRIKFHVHLLKYAQAFEL